MGLGDLWNRTLVYFGIAEEYDDGWDDGYLTEEELEQTYVERPRANVRRLTPRRRDDDYDDWTVSESHVLRDAGDESAARRTGREPVLRRGGAGPCGPLGRREAGGPPPPRAIEAVPRA